MSIASASRTIKLIAKVGTYNPTIVAPNGDIYQEYEGTQDNPGAITPNFEATQPKLLFVCTSSRVSEGIVTPNSMRYFFNNSEISFGTDGVSTGSFAGYFKKIVPDTGNQYYGLQLLKNIVQLAGYASVVIRMEAAVSYATQVDTLKADYRISVGKSTGTSYRVTIAAGDGNNFVLRQKGAQCILKAVTYQSGTELTSGLTYAWYKMTNVGWYPISGQTGQTLTVTDNDVDTWGEFQVVVSKGGNELGFDTQAVIDASDPYEIEPHPSPEDEAIYEDTNGNGQVTYTPVVVKRGSTTKAFDSQFYFIAKDAAGNILNTTSRTPASTFTVTRAMCQQAGGDIALVIMTAD